MHKGTAALSACRNACTCAPPAKTWSHKCQPCISLSIFSIAKVESVAIEKIESEIHGWHLCDQVFAGGAHVHAFLQALKAAVPLCIESDDLSVDNCLVGRQSLRERGQFGIAFGDVNAVTRTQRQSAILNSG